MTDDTMVQNVEGAETLEATTNLESTGTENVEESSSPDQGNEESTGDVLSERGQNRVQQLANKAAEAQTQAAQVRVERDTLRDELSSLTSTPKPQSADQSFPWMKQPEQRMPLGEEVTPDQYWNHVEAEATRKADSIVDLKLRQFQQNQEIKENYGNDISELESTYPDAFNSNDPELKKEFKRSFDLYRKTLQVDPTIRFKEFAGPLLKARSIGVEKGRGEATTTLSQQADEMAVKPSSARSESSTSEEQLMKMLRNGEISIKDAEKQMARLQ